MGVYERGAGCDEMAKFFIAGCFADNIVMDRDNDTIEKKEGGPAYF
ncbi:MAG: hypothetical protein GY852_09460, partial [bacterium]|nr:hypothetical protein [bacterium]